MLDNEKLQINFDMNAIANAIDNAIPGKKTDESKKSEEGAHIDNKLQVNIISEMVNKIADNIDSSSEKPSTREVDEKKSASSSPEKDKSDKNLAPTLIDSNLMPSILNNVVQKIQVNDGCSDDNQLDEIPKETFGMTEATEAKPNDEENENENEDEDENNEEVQQTTSKNKKKKQESEDDEDDENIVQYTDEQLNEAFELFKQDKTLPPFLMRDAIIDYARRQSLQFMVDENYDAAYKNDLSVNDLLLELSKDSGGYTTESITRNLESRIEMAKEQRHASNEKYQKRIATVKENEQKKLQQLIEIQSCERKQFELDCQSAEFLQRFSKPSKKLLQIRKIQKALALAHKFDEAKTIKAEGDALQRSETIQAKRRAIRYIRTSYQKLLEKQQNQLNCAAENKDRKIRALLDQLERENAANQNLTRQLEIRLKETKSKKGSCLPPLISSGPKKAPSKSTLRQLADYKSTQKVSMLNVKLTNIQKIVGHVKPPTKPIKIV